MITNKKLVFEVLELARKARKKAEKIKILKENNSGALQDILRGTYDDRIQWLLPTGSPPPYKENKPESVPSNLLKECIKFKYLVKGPGDNVNPVKRETIFIGILEAIHPEDAKLLLNMINKKPIQGITKPVAEEAFPKLFR